MVNLQTTINVDFYREEERCGFLVTQQRKEIWAVEIDLILQLDRMCQKYDLKYCCGAGTLLGAVRHHGFIPWDDDVDVYMLRDDYDRLMEHACEFPAPYFLQNSNTEKYLIKNFARLRNSNTLGATNREINTPVNRGIFIDIFPIDGVSEKRSANSIQKIKNKVLKSISICYNYSKSFAEERAISNKLRKAIYKLVAFLFVWDKDGFFRLMDNNLKKYSHPNTRIWGNRTLVFDCPKSRRLYEDYANITYMPFEMIQVPVPENYDSMLRQQYGDYMKIPENKHENMHGGLTISTDYAYDDPRRISK